MQTIEKTNSVTRGWNMAQDMATRTLQGAVLVANSSGYVVQSVPVAAAKAIAAMQGEAVTGHGKVIAVMLP